MVPQQTKRLQGGKEFTNGFQYLRNQVKRGYRENEKDEDPQGYQTSLGTQGQRSKNQDHWKKRSHRWSHQKEMIQNI